MGDSVREHSFVSTRNLGSFFFDLAVRRLLACPAALSTTITQCESRKSIERRDDKSKFAMVEIVVVCAWF
eukprot:scaffold12333_cov167-Amphora_coffeaeformis.AAC.1